MSIVDLQNRFRAANERLAHSTNGVKREAVDCGKVNNNNSLRWLKIAPPAPLTCSDVSAAK